MSANVRMTGRGEPMPYDDPEVPQDARSVDSGAANAEIGTDRRFLSSRPISEALPLEPPVAERVERPDLESIKASAQAIDVQADTRGWLAWLLIRVVEYALQLEQDAAGARKNLERYGVHTSTCPVRLRYGGKPGKCLCGLSTLLMAAP
jgi:hypothetical protein